MTIDRAAAEGWHREIEVDPDGAGERLDVFVAAALELSRTRVHKLLEDASFVWRSMYAVHLRAWLADARGC